MFSCNWLEFGCKFGYTITILSNKIEVLIPESFDIMSEEMLKHKYPLETRPTLVYTNEDGTVNVAFNLTYIHRQSQKQMLDKVHSLVYYPIR
jgi:hypothetical protein